MVTRRVIRISPPQKEALARKPAQDEKTSSSVAVVDSFNNNDDNDTVTKTQAKQKSRAPLCNHPSCIRRAQHPSPLCWMHCAQARDVTCRFSGCNNKGILLGLCPDHGGLVQLCRWRGCINVANLEKRGGLCWMHHAKGGHDYDDDSSSSEEEEEGIRLCRFRGCISCATADDGLCDMHTPNHGSSGISKKRVYALEHSCYNDAEKRQRTAFVIDLTNVPPQPPIPKSFNRIKEGASKYTGVCFNKQMNKWQALIFVDGKQRSIGYYDEEEEAAVDYARALFKYKGQGAIDKAMEKQNLQKSLLIDLSDVPSQPPILKSAGRIKEGASKYTGVFQKATKKWVAQIMINGKQNHIGTYDSEMEAAVDYARALFKYKGQGSIDKATEQKESYQTTSQRSLEIDLSDVPSQPPILKSAGRIKEGASKYTGVSFQKATKKWVAQIMINGKQNRIGSYDSEMEAAVDYARALVKYKRQAALIAHGSLIYDLSDVPQQPPILKSAGRIKEGASKYTGVCFYKPKNKWVARIKIDGKARHIGYYENEEEAAVDYARALVKYKEQAAIHRAKRMKNLGVQQRPLVIDLSDVPSQPPILKNAVHMKDGASKYTGVSFAKKMKKWVAQIMINGKQFRIGYYDNEEEAAADYARAAFKYKPKKSPEGCSTYYGQLDLKDVPDHLLRNNEKAKSGLKGVKRNVVCREASLDGKAMETFDMKEAAAGIYARYNVEEREKLAATTMPDELIDLEMTI